MSNGTAPQLAPEQKKEPETDLNVAELAVPISKELETKEPARDLVQNQAPAPSTSQDTSLEQASLSNSYSDRLKKKTKLAQSDPTTSVTTNTSPDKSSSAKSSVNQEKKKPQQTFVSKDPTDILGRLVTYLANILKKMEQWLLKKLPAPKTKKKIVLSKPEDKEELEERFEGRLRKKKKKGSTTGS